MYTGHEKRYQQQQSSIVDRHKCHWLNHAKKLWSYIIFMQCMENKYKIKYWHILIYMYQKIATTTTARFVAAKSWKRKKIDLQHTHTHMLHANNIPQQYSITEQRLQVYVATPRGKDSEGERKIWNEKGYISGCNKILAWCRETSQSFQPNKITIPAILIFETFYESDVFLDSSGFSLQYLGTLFGHFRVGPNARKPQSHKESEKQWTRFHENIFEGLLQCEDASQKWIFSMHFLIYI